MRKLAAALLVAALVACSNPGYQVKGEEVVYRQRQSDGRIIDLPLKVDVDSFEILDANYARDKFSAFFGADALDGSQPATFVVLTFPYSKDADNVYYKAERIGRDASHFQILQDEFSKDSQSVYFRSYPLQADPETFRVLRPGSGYASDDSSVYWARLKLDRSSPATFELLNRYYARDEQQAWYRGKLLPDADPASLVLVDEHYASDGKHVYYQDEPLPGALAESFEPLAGGYFRDQATVYFDGQPIPGADPSTFEVDSARPHRARDKNRSYDKGKPSSS
ncbi:MAG: DKNYY domain-containing protein [Candidatus Eremiobacteraeota bacterium]|nr:DKNYY domain-containing protein [Candidatus Eremiobacteraeota bacterium]